MGSSKIFTDLCGSKSLKEYALHIEKEACITIQKYLKQKCKVMAKLRLKSTWNFGPYHFVHTVTTNNTQELFDKMILASSSYDLSVNTEVFHPKSNSKSVFNPAFNAKSDQPIHA